MDDFDRLPQPARQWLAQAALPWSVPSVRRLWGKALKESGGSVTEAQNYLSQIEDRRLAKDTCWTADVWPQKNAAPVSRA
jgi:hypothetical protein